MAAGEEALVAALRAAGAEAAAEEQGRAGIGADGGGTYAYVRSRWVSTSAVSARRRRRRETAREEVSSARRALGEEFKDARDLRRLFAALDAARVAAGDQELGLALPNGAARVDDDLVRDLVDTDIGRALVSLDLAGNLFLRDPFPAGAEFRALKSLRMGHCIRLSKSAVATAIASFPSLRSLELACCLSVDNDALVSLAQNLPHLVHLDIAGCSQVTDRGLGSLAALRGAQLVSLNVTGLWEISRRGLVGDGVADGAWTRLEAFSCVGCTRLEDGGVVGVLERCAHARLQVLHVAGVRSLTNAVLRALERSESLREVDVSDNTRISTDAARSLLLQNRAQSQSLRVFRARSCPLVDSRLVAAFPEVDIEVDAPLDVAKSSKEVAPALAKTTAVLAASYAIFRLCLGPAGAALWMRGLQAAATGFVGYLVVAVTVFAVACAF